MKGKVRKAAVALLAVLLAACFLLPLFPVSSRELWSRAAGWFGLSDFSGAANDSPFALFVLDVGAADSLVLQCNGHTVLIDGATQDRAEEISSFLKRRGVTQLDLVVNTHPDADHIGGLAGVLREFPVKAYWSPALEPSLLPDTPEYLAVQAVLREKQISETHPAAGTVFPLDGGEIQVLAPVLAGDSANNSSLVLRVSYGQTRFLFMGDAEKEEEASLLQSGVDLTADVLKVGHHGSKTSTSQPFLAAVRPRYAAISVADNSNHLPKGEVLLRLQQSGAQVFQTDACGALLFLSDGEQVKLVTER